MMKRLASIFLLAASASIPGPTLAANDENYVLTDGSVVEVGCHGPCACPVLQRDLLGGKFTLIFRDFDGLYRNYDVVNLRWKAPFGGSEVEVTGGGHYRVGGEVAVQQQLTLDLSFDGIGPKRWDSGLVPGGGEFPAIDIFIEDLEPACYDTAFRVRAKPAGPAGRDGPAPGAARLAVAPNPFRGSTELVFTPVDALAELEVLDLAGRVVRALGRCVPGNPGSRRVVWDGRDRSGASVPSGIYYARLRSRSGSWWRAIVKLD